MKPENKGCSTCKNGVEHYESYKSGKKQLIQYDYRTINGKLFSTVKKNLRACRVARNAWFKALD